MSVKSVLITGCSSGIGLCLAEGLQRRGYRVFATARKSQDVTALQAKGLEALRLDLIDSKTIHETVAAVLQRSGGGLDAVINNGAYGQAGAVEDLSRAVLREQFETNLFGAVELTNLVIPTMRAQGHGRIIQISSILGLAALPYRGAYNASKFALEGISDTLRLELAGSNIHVSLIEPGPIKSRFRVNSLEMFKRHIDVTSSAHRDNYQGVLRRLEKEGPATPFTLPPEAVLQRVIHALENPRPKIRYYVTLPTSLFAALRRFLPYSWLDRVLLAISRDENK
jgi:NAD(P)-dependent dehydrogenase (short-subunit alcohol dehydrogenase family)